MEVPLQQGTAEEICSHVKILQKATVDWLVHDVMQRHPFSSSGGFIIAAFLLCHWFRKGK